MSVTEKLREALLDLEEARKKEAQQRQTAEALLAGLQVLTTNEPNQIFPRLFDVLQNPLDFRAAFILAEGEDGLLLPIAMSDPRFHKTVWKPGASFHRAMKGNTLAIFDTAEVGEWQNQSQALRKKDRSALIFYVGSSIRPALFVCTHPERAHFSRRHINLAHRFSILAVQAMMKFEADHRVVLLEQRLETETKVAELHRKLAESEKKLARIQKLESIGILAGGVAHDFNNLLHAMRGNIELLAGSASLDPQGTTRLQSVIRSMDRAAQLVQQLLLFSRKAEFRRVRVDVNQEVKDVARMLERSIPRMINLAMRLDPTLYPVPGNPVQIEQILLNLANNAVDAMPKGGRLEVKTCNVVLDEDFVRLNPGSTPGRHVLLTVTDTGSGMDKDVLDHVFDPFFTTKEVGKGTGLGLASVYGIVKAHDGFIQCSSEPGKGTTFKVFLPAMKQEDVGEMDSQPEASFQGGSQGGSETILVVDDEPEIRELTREALESLGYAVKEAVNGEEALRGYKEYGQSIDLVLLDMNMPGMGGHECLHELLRINPSVKVVIASGYTANGHGKGTLTSGAKGFISKPYRLRELAVMVRRVLDEAGAGAE
ncbi:MAG TPA: response regulator [Desulfonatronum sp.]|nr:response regulator [Desulfonatronum sp.]